MKKVLRVGIFSVICIALIVGYFYYLTSRNSAISNTREDISEVQAILDKDFVNDYPPTPRATVKWYNRIITALYSQDYSDEEFAAMASQIRCLLDDDLLELNPEDIYINSLERDVLDYRNRSKVIVNSEVCSTDEVEYKTIKGERVAYVSAYYFTREGSTYDRTYQDFCLRKDSDGNWKILTFKLSKKDDTNEF